MTRGRMTFRLVQLVVLALLPLGCAGSPEGARDTGGERALLDSGSAGNADLSAPACAFFAPAATVGALASDEISEGSGLLASRANPDVFWTHNDSGDTARVFAFNRQGRHLGIYTLQGVTAVDWEDIAAGPGPEAGKQYLHLADIGDNALSRAEIAVYRAAEPTVSSTQAPVDGTLSSVEKIALRYPDEPHNAETLLVDPSTGDFYIITKSSDGVSPVYASRAPQETAGTRTLSKVATLVFGSGALASTGQLATGGDISPDGQEIVIRTHEVAALWQWPAGIPMATVFGNAPCLIKLAAEEQGEGISFDAAKSCYTMSEGEHSPLHVYLRR